MAAGPPGGFREVQGPLPVPVSGGVLAAAEECPGEKLMVVGLVRPLHRPPDPTGRGSHLPCVLVQPRRRLRIRPAKRHQLHAMHARRRRKDFLDDRDLVEHTSQGIPGSEQVVRANQGMPLLAQVHQKRRDVVSGADREPDT